MRSHRRAWSGIGKTITEPLHIGVQGVTRIAPEPDIIPGNNTAREYPGHDTAHLCPVLPSLVLSTAECSEIRQYCHHETRTVL